MKRRDVLKAAPTIATASAAGLAGCGILGGGCSAPSGSPSDVLATGGDTFTKQATQTGGGGQLLKGVKSAARATYTDGSGNQLTMQVYKFGSKSQAKKAEETLKQFAKAAGGEQSGTGGYVRAGTYIITASGPSKSKVKSLLGTSSLGSGCVGSFNFIV